MRFVVLVAVTVTVDSTGTGLAGAGLACSGTGAAGACWARAASGASSVPATRWAIREIRGWRGRAVGRVVDMYPARQLGRARLSHGGRFTDVTNNDSGTAAFAALSYTLRLTPTRTPP